MAAALSVQADPLTESRESQVESARGQESRAESQGLLEPADPPPVKLLFAFQVQRRHCSRHSIRVLKVAARTVTVGLVAARV
jgi:hypothetical protein